MTFARRLGLVWLLSIGALPVAAQVADPQFERGFSYGTHGSPFNPSVWTSRLQAMWNTGVRWLSITVFLSQEAVDKPVIFAVSDAPNEAYSVRAYGSEYVRQDTDSSLVHRWHHTPSDAELREAIRIARAIGLKLMVKVNVFPQRAGVYAFQDTNGNRAWDAGESREETPWPGLIYMNSEAEWDDWFRRYENFLVEYGKIARDTGVEQMCLATEMSGTYRQDARWSRLIDNFRSRSGYAGAITVGFDWFTTFLHRYGMLLDTAFAIKQQGGLWLLGTKVSDGASPAQLLDMILGEALAAVGMGMHFDSPAIQERMANIIFREKFYGTAGNLLGGYSRVRDIWWVDKLTYLGIDPYYPLNRTAAPTFDQIKAGWRGYDIRDAMAKSGLVNPTFRSWIGKWGLASADLDRIDWVGTIRELQTYVQKPILFAEGPGYFSTTDATVNPVSWVSNGSSQTSATTQRDAYRAFFEVFSQESYLKGVFFWDAAEGFPGFPRFGPNEQTITVIREWYGKGPTLVGDVDGNGLVDITDLVLVARAFGGPYDRRADVNGDGAIDITDLVLVAKSFGEATSTKVMRMRSVLSAPATAEPICFQSSEPREGFLIVRGTGFDSSIRAFHGASEISAAVSDGRTLVLASDQVGGGLVTILRGDGCGFVLAGSSLSRIDLFTMPSTLTLSDALSTDVWVEVVRSRLVSSALPATASAEVESLVTTALLSGGRYHLQVAQSLAGRDVRIHLRLDASGPGFVAHREEVCGPSVTVRYRPDLTVGTVSAPRQVAAADRAPVSAEIRELKGDTAGTATVSLEHLESGGWSVWDRSSGVYARAGGGVTVNFSVLPATLGVHRFRLSVSNAEPREWTTTNNQREFEIEVVAAPLVYSMQFFKVDWAFWTDFNAWFNFWSSWPGMGSFASYFYYTFGMQALYSGLSFQGSTASALAWPLSISCRVGWDGADRVVPAEGTIWPQWSWGDTSCWYAWRDGFWMVVDGNSGGTRVWAGAYGGQFSYWSVGFCYSWGWGAYGSYFYMGSWGYGGAYAWGQVLDPATSVHVTLSLRDARGTAVGGTATMPVTGEGAGNSASFGNSLSGSGTLYADGASWPYWWSAGYWGNYGYRYGFKWGSQSGVMR